MIELLVVVDPQNVDVIPQRVADDGVANVLQMRIWLAADGAIFRVVQVHMAAVIALHAPRLEVGSEQQRLHFSNFERTQYAPQTNGSVAVAMRFTDHFANHALLLLAL